ncbi:MAG: ribosome silencing factor [Candidatus Sumerlaeia bacterium]|nr:ribosome silencing factor [Candidatus Sumerlaeia bacterium]
MLPILSAREKARRIARIGDEMKATDIVVLDVKRICSFTDVIVLCTGTSRIHLRAVAHKVEETLRQRGIRPLSVEGVNDTGWAVLDYGDVVAHIFTDESRRYYNLERLWGDGKPVEWRRAKRPAARKKIEIRS